MRDEIFDRLSRLRQVDSAGGYRRNTAPLSVRAYKGDWDMAAVAWQSQYRFSISVENSSTPGYSTEKIVHALAAGTIPIYFGDPLIGRVFNPSRFINVHELGLEAAMDQVGKLDADSEAFEEMVSQPIFRDGAVPPSSPRTISSMPSASYSNSLRNSHSGATRTAGAGCTRTAADVGFSEQAARCCGGPGCGLRGRPGRSWSGGMIGRFDQKGALRTQACGDRGHRLRRDGVGGANMADVGSGQVSQVLHGQRFRGNVKN